MVESMPYFIWPAPPQDPETRDEGSSTMYRKQGRSGKIAELRVRRGINTVKLVSDKDNTIQMIPRKISIIKKIKYVHLIYFLFILYFLLDNRTKDLL